MTSLTLVLFLLLTIVFPTALALQIWPRRSAGAAAPFIAWMASLALWGMLQIGQFAVSTPDGQLFWENLSISGLLLVSGLWSYFFLRLIHSPLLAQRRSVAFMIAAGFLLALFAWTDNLHHILRPEVLAESRPDTVSNPGIAFQLFLVLVSLMPVAGAVLLLREGFAGRFSRRAPLLWLLIAAASPFAGLVLSISGVNLVTALGPIAAGYALSGLACAWAILQHNLLDYYPVVREILFESTTSGVLVLSPDNRLAQVNPAAFRLLGLPQEDMRGRDIRQALPLAAAGLADKIEAAPAEPFEIEIKQNDGSTYLDVRSTPLDDRDEGPSRMFVLRDITAAKRTELALRNQKQLLENLVAIARASTKVSDIQTTFQNILSIAAELTGAQVGSLFLLDREGKVINSILARGDVPREVRNPILDQVMDSGLAGWAVRHNRPAIIEDTRLDDRWVEVPGHPHPVRSALSIPITSSNGTLGVLTLEHDTPGHFTGDHSTLMQAAADQIALALRNAQVHEEQQQVNRRQVMLYKVLRSVSGHLDPETILEVALNAVHSETEVPAIAVLMPGRDAGELVVQASVGREAPAVGVGIPMDTSSAGKAFRTGKSCIVGDIGRDADVQPTNPRLASELSVLLMSGQRITGVMSFESDRPGFFDNEDMMLAESVADAISLALDNASLYQETQHRLEEQTLLRKAAEQISSTPDLFGGLSYLANQMVQTFRLRKVSIYRYEDGGKQPSLVVEAPAGNSQAPNIEAASPGPDQNLVDQMRAGQIVIQQNGEQPGQTRPEGGEAGPAGLVFSPFLVRDRFIGFAEMLQAEPGLGYSEDELALMRAISQQAALALQRAQLFEDIQNARQAAEDADAAKSEFITVLAHELQGPMTSIKGFAEMLSVGSMGPINESQRNFLKIIQSTVDRMSLLVSELTDISRIESGHLSLKLEDVDPADVIQEVMVELQGQATQNKQELSSQIEPGLPKVMADPSRLAQILTNLLTNAVKYTPHGGRITITARPHQNGTSYVQISVEDTGIGISLEDQPRVFEKFFRTQDELARDITGTGLGLNITRHLVELQGGKIWFESRLRQGSTFHFTLPAARTKDA